MPVKAMRPCVRNGCGKKALPKLGTCRAHTQQVRAHSDRKREGTRGSYSHKAWRECRAVVLDVNPWCVLCGHLATVADHHPIKRRDLVAQGLDPNDPDRCRSLCKPCHDRHTGTNENPNRFGGGR
jgi:5-methylcytosine-specific restriction protein A